MSEPTPPTQAGQTVHGPQTNIAGGVTQYGGLFNTGIIQGNIVIPPPQPTLATPPAPPPDFVGRTEQLAQLAATLTAGRSAAITALHGMGGVGKTALAQQLADQLKPAFPGGILWGDLALHSGSAETILRAWGAIYGADFSQESDLAVLSERLRGLLSMRRSADGALLAVLDDVRTEWLPAAQLLQKSLPADTPLLITIRDVDLATPLDAEVVRLDVLPEPDAHDLLAARVKPKEILTPEETVKALLKNLGYLPMAIRLAAGHVNKFARKPGFELGQFVDDVGQRAVSLLDAAGGAGLAATFAISYEALTVEQQRIFRYCSVYSPALLTVEHMAALLDLEFALVEAALDELVMVALLAWDQEIKERYVLHPLVSQYAYELLTQNDNTQVIHIQAAEYLKLKLANPKIGATPQEGLEEIDQWEKAHEWQTMIERACTIAINLQRSGYWHEIDKRLAKAQSVLNLVNDNQVFAAHLFSVRGAIAHRRNHWNDGIKFCEQSLKIFTQLGDSLRIAGSLINLGALYIGADEWDRAIDLYQQSLQINSDIHIAQSVYNGLGLIYHAKGEWDRAIQYYKQSLDINIQMNDTHSAAVTNANLGSIYQDKGELEESIRCYKVSLQTFLNSDDFYGSAQIYNRLGLVYQILGEWEKATDLYQHAFEFFKQAGDRRGIADVYNNLGSVLKSIGDWEQAINLFQMSLQINQQLGNHVNVANALMNLGSVYCAQGDFENAITFLEESAHVNAQVSNSYGFAQVSVWFGNVYIATNRLEEAIQSYEHALHIFSNIGASHDIAGIYNNLGSLYLTRSEWDKAANYLNISFAMFTKIGDHHGIASVYGNLGLLFQRQNLRIRAINYLGRAYRIFAKLETPDELVQIIGRLVDALGSSEAVQTYLVQMATVDYPLVSTEELEGITDQELFVLVVQARHGDHKLGSQLFTMLQQITTHSAVSTEYRALARVLKRVLVGINNPDLSELSFELADAVRKMIIRITEIKI